jgi:fluoroacetyl-CoA thioesterase
MKPGLMEGQTATIMVEVNPDMFAQFEGEVVHPAYSTVSMVYHMEWASRQVILPYLEEDEEGMGAAVSVEHLMPAGEGTPLTITAKLVNYKNNMVLTNVEVRNENTVIGKGEVKQVILPKEKIKRKLKTTT